MVSAPCSHLGIEGAEAGAGAMLGACRLPVYPRWSSTMPSAARARNPADGVAILPDWGARTALGSDIGRKPAGGPDGLKAPNPTP
jgi:hypothetical protein